MIFDSETSKNDLSPQPTGDPDTNDNDIALIGKNSFNGMIYETEAVLMAITKSVGDFQMTADTRLFDKNVAGRPYSEIAQDMVDFLAFSQKDIHPWWRGGWGNPLNYNDPDMWNTSWAVFGLQAAEGINGITVPEWVKHELEAGFLNWIQGEDGGFGNNFPGESNVSRTGGGLACQEWVGLGINDSGVQATTDYLDAIWEIFYTLNPLSDDALEDSDNYAFTNLQEYQSGSHPGDADNHPVIITGDINGDGSVEIKDAILAMQSAGGIRSASAVYKKASINVSDKIGLPEAIYILQVVAGVRAQ